MPYVDLVTGQDDYASLWYTTNSLSGTVGDFDPDKPIIIMLHPIFLDSEWLYLQLQDPRLDHNFNIIAFDARCAGRTQSRPNGKHDHWTDAADLAFAIQVRLLSLYPFSFPKSSQKSHDFVFPRLTPRYIFVSGVVVATRSHMGLRVLRNEHRTSPGRTVRLFTPLASWTDSVTHRPGTRAFQLPRDVSKSRHFDRAATDRVSPLTSDAPRPL